MVHWWVLVHCGRLVTNHQLGMEKQLLKIQQKINQGCL
jgi:hypothetical protein